MTEATDKTKRAAIVVAALLIGQLVASRALRDGFFLSHFEPSALPTMMTGSAILSVIVVLGSTRVLRGIAPARSMPLLFVGSALLFVVEWALSLYFPRVIAVVLYLHIMSLGAVVTSGFWSVVNERFDPYAAKQLIARIGGGASVGGVLGGVSVWWGASSLEIPTMILILGVLNAACAIGIIQIGAGDHDTARTDAPPDSTTQIFRATPYLRHLALLVALGAFCQATYDYVFKARAAAIFETSAELVSFFALFYMALNLVTFVVQNLLAQRSLKLFGLTFTVGTLPGSGAIFGAIALAFPGLPAAAAMRGGIGVTENSLFRSGYELLFTPILPEKKRPTKTLIDVGGDKIGTALGGAAAFIVLAIAPSVANVLLVMAGIIASVCGVYVTRRLHFGYVASLEESLRAGSLSLESVEIADATTQFAVEEIREALGRSDALRREELGTTSTPDQGVDLSILVEREQLRSGLDDSTRTATSRAQPAQAHAPYRPPPLPIEPEELDEITIAIGHLRSADPDRVGQVLRVHSPLPSELVSHTIPLLRDERVAELAFEALSRVAAANTGALLDALRKTWTDLTTRRRLCEMLGRLATQRSANGLIEMLSDRDFELRFRAAQSLYQIHRQNPRLRIPEDRIYEAAEVEAAACHGRWLSRTALDSRISPTPAIESVEGRRVNQGLTYIWSLLLAVLDPEPLKLAIRALTSPTGGHRGTGLEYMENVLPPPLMSALRPLFLDLRLATGVVRSRASILTEVMSDRADESRDLAALKRHIDELRGRRA
ncbi:MAG: hypothetical protein JRH17_24255 [Deltaproteobacteria bacterium]|nr:hypothetical protein [Deltaproteobacteria bacterium]